MLLLNDRGESGSSCGKVLSLWTRVAAADISHLIPRFQRIVRAASRAPGGWVFWRQYHVATKQRVLKGLDRVNVIRFTIVDERGTSSFVGPCHAIKMLVAACSRHPRVSNQLLEFTRPYDESFARSVESGLAIFDEHNTRENYAAFHELMASTSPVDLPPFRVVDDRTRQLSLKPVATGLILFNLIARRIIQVQNSYAEVLRADRGRVRQNGRPTRRLYYYSLPEEWNIVP